MKKRVLSLVLCLCMALTLLPTTAFAAVNYMTDAEMQTALVSPNSTSNVTISYFKSIWTQASTLGTTRGDGVQFTTQRNSDGGLWGYARGYYMYFVVKMPASGACTITVTGSTSSNQCPLSMLITKHTGLSNKFSPNCDNITDSGGAKIKGVPQVDWHESTLTTKSATITKDQLDGDYFRVYLSMTNGKDDSQMEQADYYPTTQWKNVIFSDQPSAQVTVSTESASKGMIATADMAGKEPVESLDLGNIVYKSSSDKVLVALPKKGYDFDGWYVDDTKVTDSIVYVFNNGFAAKSQINLKAKFTAAETNERNQFLFKDQNSEGYSSGDYRINWKWKSYNPYINNAIFSGGWTVRNTSRRISKGNPVASLEAPIYCATTSTFSLHRFRESYLPLRFTIDGVEVTPDKISGPKSSNYVVNDTVYVRGITPGVHLLKIEVLGGDDSLSFIDNMTFFPQSVPLEHTLTINDTSLGTVTYNGTDYTEESNNITSNAGAFSMTATPADPDTISFNRWEIYQDGELVQTEYNPNLSLPDLEANSTFKAFFTKTAEESMKINYQITGAASSTVLDSDFIPSNCCVNGAKGLKWTLANGANYNTQWDYRDDGEIADTAAARAENGIYTTDADGDGTVTPGILIGSLKTQSSNVINSMAAYFSYKGEKPLYVTVKGSNGYNDTYQFNASPEGWETCTVRLPRNLSLQMFIGLETAETTTTAAGAPRIRGFKITTSSGVEVDLKKTDIQTVFYDNISADADRTAATDAFRTALAKTEAFAGNGTSNYFQTSSNFSGYYKIFDFGGPTSAYIDANFPKQLEFTYTNSAGETATAWGCRNDTFSYTPRNCATKTIDFGNYYNFPIIGDIAVSYTIKTDDKTGLRGLDYVAYLDPINPSFYSPGDRGKDPTFTCYYEYKKQGDDDSTYTTDAPTELGKYTVRGNFSETTKFIASTDTLDFEILPKRFAYVSDRKLGTIPYTGTEQSYKDTPNYEAFAKCLIFSDNGNDDTMTSMLPGTYTVTASPTANATIYNTGSGDPGTGSVQFEWIIGKANPQLYGEAHTNIVYDGNPIVMGEDFDITPELISDKYTLNKYDFSFNYIKDGKSYRGLPTEIGTYEVQAYYLGDKYYSSNYSNYFDLTINAVPITVKVASIDDKEYDGTTTVKNATLTLVAGDGSALPEAGLPTVTGDVAFADKNAGENKKVNITNLKLSDTSAYQLAATTLTDVETTAKITQKPITISGITANDKKCDGTDVATLDYTNVKFDGIVGEDELTVSAKGIFDNANAGPDKEVTISDLKLDGTDAANYVLAATGQQDKATASITQSESTISITNIQSNIIYDGSAVAEGTDFTVTKTGSAGTVSYQYKTSTTDWTDGLPKDAGVYQIRATVAADSNYAQQISNPADLTIKKVQLTPTVKTVGGKTYDKTASTTGTLTLTGDIVTDEVPTATGTFTFDDVNAGKDKSVSVAGIALDTQWQTNYELTVTSLANQTSTAAIAKCPVTVSGITANGKTYDGKKDAVLDCSKAVFDGIIKNDSLSVTATGTFENANAGENKTVKLTDLVLGGTSVANYELAATGQQTETTATIGQASSTISISGVQSNIVYDGSAVAEGTDFTVTKTGSAGAVTYQYKLTSTTDWTDGLPKDAGVYQIRATVAEDNNYAEKTSDPADLTIKKIQLTPTVKTVDGKTYDKTGATTGTLTLTGDIVTEEAPTATGTFVFDDVNAGKDKSVSVTNITLEGKWGTNYELTATSLAKQESTAAIAKCPVTVSGITAENKDYDQGDATKLIYTGVKFGGIIKNDSLSVTATGTFENANAGKDKTVKLTNLVLGGTSVANYELAATGQQATAKATITPITLTISGVTATDRTYDTTDKVELAGGELSDDVLQGDTVEFTLGNGTMKDANAGNNKGVTTNITLSNPNYALTQPTNVTVSIAKAASTGAPKYTAITSGDKTLADAKLTTADANFNTTGSVKWVDAEGQELGSDTAVKANTAYKWLFTPDDLINYTTLEGSITLYPVAMGGTTTDKVTNPDGSTTTTVTDKTTGTITETTEKPDGATTVVETKKDGTATTTDKATNGVTTVTETDKDGVATGTTVTVPTTVKDPVKVDVPTDLGKTDGKVSAVVTYPDGKKETVTGSYSDGKVSITVNGSSTVEILDDFVPLTSALPFTDVPLNAWYYDELVYDYNNGLFAGTSPTTFSPKAPMTRQQMWMVLARMAGEKPANMDEARTWAMAKEISDGTNPTSNVTREQFVTLLWRFAGSPKATKDISGYSDFNTVADYAKEAMSWAVENGIISGTTPTTLSPMGNAIREQVAAILARYSQK